MSTEAGSPTLFVYGDIAADVTVRADHERLPTCDVADCFTTLTPGGSAANCAVAAARLGVPVEFIGVTGSDHLGQMLVEDMHHNAVGTRYLRRTDGPTAIIVVVVDAEGEKTFYSFRGASASVAYGPVPPDIFLPGDYLHLSGYGFQDSLSRETALELIDRARTAGAVISLDPSFHSARDFRTKLRPVLSEIALAIPNDEEARQMTGEDSPEGAAGTIREFGPQTVVITLGAGGCYLSAGPEDTHVPAYPVQEVMDVNGAGDAFCGGFLAGVLRGMTPTQAARLANAVASHVITRVGGHAGTPTIDEVVLQARENGDDDLAATIKEILL